MSVLGKSPFAIDSRPLEEMGSAHAGLLAASRALRSLNLGGLVEANLVLKSRQRGFSEGQMIAREQQKSFIMPPSAAQQGLDRVLAGLVGQVARLLKKHGQEQTIATVDQDATIIESHKKSALFHYDKGRGY